MITLAADHAELVRLHRLEMQRRGLAPGSIDKRRLLLMHLAVALEPAQLLDATAEQIQRFLDGRPIGARARYAYISNLHAFYAWAVRAGHTDRDPTVEIQRPKFPTGQPRPIHADDLRAALEMADPVTALMLAAGAYAGMRCCEIAQMSRQDLRNDLAEPSILAHGKGGVERTVPLHPKLVEALERHGIPRNGPILRRPDGRAMPAWAVSQQVNNYLHGLGIPATAHQLRHWFASSLYRQSGHDLLLVSKLLGHANLVTTQVYAAADITGAYAAVAALAV